MATTRKGTGHAYHASAHRSAAPLSAVTVVGPAVGGNGSITTGAAGGGLMYVPGDGSEPAGFGFALSTDDYGFAPGDDSNPLNGSGFDGDVSELPIQTYGGSGGTPALQSGDVSGSYANAKRHRYHSIAAPGSSDPAAPNVTASRTRSPKRAAMDGQTWWARLTTWQKVLTIGGVTVIVVGGLLYWAKTRKGGGGVVIPTRFGHFRNAVKSLHSAVHG